MAKHTLYYFILILTIFGCKKESTSPDTSTVSSNPSSTSNPSGTTPNGPWGPSTGSNNSYCTFYTTISPDTNYIPHKKNNSWSYCVANVADWQTIITLDTIINNRICFEMTYDWGTAHPVGPTHFVDKMFIDVTGNYYSKTGPDSLLLINPNAVNGDTIFNNPIGHVKVVLVDNSETIGSLTNCYHVRVIDGYPNNNTIMDYYFKKGIGRLFIGQFKLYRATIY